MIFVHILCACSWCTKYPYLVVVQSTCSWYAAAAYAPSHDWLELLTSLELSSHAPDPPVTQTHAYLSPNSTSSHGPEQSKKYLGHQIRNIENKYKLTH